MTFHPCTAIMRAVAVATLLIALSAPRANAQAPCQDELTAVQNAKTAVSDASKAVRAFAAMAEGWLQQLNDLALQMGSIVEQAPEEDGVTHISGLPPDLLDRARQLATALTQAKANMKEAAREGADALTTLAQRNVDLATAQQAYSQCLGAAIHAAADAPPADIAGFAMAGSDVGQAVAGLLSALTDSSASNANGANGNAGTGAGGSNSGQAGSTANNFPNTITPNPNQYSVPAGPAPPPGQSTSTPASDPTAGNAGNYIQQAIAALVSALTNNAGNNNTNANTAGAPSPLPGGGQSNQQMGSGQSGQQTSSGQSTSPSGGGQFSQPAGSQSGQQGMSQPATGQPAQSTQSPKTNQPANNGPTNSSNPTQTTMLSPTAQGATQQPKCPSGYVNWSCRNAQGTTSGCLTPQDAANDTAQYKAMGYTCSTGSQPSPSTPTSTAATPPPLAPNGGASTTPTNIICGYTTVPPGTALAGFSQTFGVAASVCPSSWCLNNNQSPPIDTGHGAAVNPSAQCNSNQTKGYFTGLAQDLNGNFLPSAVPPSTAAASATAAAPQACKSSPPYLPWGGSGSATITVSGGQPCGIGWNDTPGGPGGVTVIDSMSVTSPPSHGSLKPQDQHMIIFTPTAGDKGQDSFTLSMQEHNGGRTATLRVKVSVTIQ